MTIYYTGEAIFKCKIPRRVEYGIRTLAKLEDISFEKAAENWFEKNPNDFEFLLDKNVLYNFNFKYINEADENDNQ